MTQASTNTLAIILNWNGKNDTLACLKSLQQAGVLGSQILVVDNGSSDDSVAAIQKAFPDIQLLETGENLGFAGGNNAGIEWGLKASFDHFLLLNNDTTVAPDFLEQFHRALADYPQVGIFGAKIYLQSQPNRLDHLGGNWNPRAAKIDFVGMRALDDGKSFETPIQLDYVCGAAMLVRKEVFEKIGLFDSRFFLYWEENDLCCRARRAGFQVQFCPQAKIWHKVSASMQTLGKPTSTYYFWRNYLLWLERNSPWSQRIIPYFKLLLMVLKLYPKMRLKKWKILYLQKRDKQRAERQEVRLAHLQAMWRGLKDYFFRRFGSC